MLDREDVTVEASDPLLALHGHLEIPQCVANIALDLAPIELRIVLNEIGWTAVAQLLVNTGFDKLVVERVELARVERIAQLANQIAGSDQASFRVGGGVVVVLRHWEAGELYGARDPLLVYERTRREALAHKNLTAFDVVGHQEASEAPRGGVTVAPAASMTKCSSVSPAQMPRTYPMSWCSAAKMVCSQSLGVIIRSRRQPCKMSWTQSVTRAVCWQSC